MKAFLIKNIISIKDYKKYQSVKNDIDVNS